MSGFLIAPFKNFDFIYIFYIFRGGDCVDNRISRRTVRRWLNEWACIVRGGPPTEEPLPRNEGCKPYDGITNRVLNKIMLETAYAALPLDLRRVAYCRWVKRMSLKEALRFLQLTQDQYYYRCDKVIEWITYFVNGDFDLLDFV